MSDIIQGFYQDVQLSSPMLIATLHPNMVPATKEKIEQYPNLKVDLNGWARPMEFEGEEYMEKRDEKDEYPYAKDPIFSSILQQDFEVSIQNSFSDVGGDQIGAAWNEMKPMAPYMNEIGKSLQMIGEKTKQYVEGKQAKARANGETPPSLDEGFSWDRFLNGFGEVMAGIGKSQQKNAEWLSRSLVTQGTMFSYYAGTGTDFGTLQMKSTIFSQYMYDKTKNEVVFKTVEDQIKEILPYVIGEFKDFSLKEMVSKEKAAEIEAEQKTKSDEEMGTVAYADKFAQEFFKWQLPPGGFAADLKNIDNIQKGTLKLRIGPYYALENLVINSCVLNFSKALVKNPEAISGTNPEDLFVPHSCEVTLNLKAITKYSRKSLERFAFGKASREYRKKIASEVLKKDYSNPNSTKNNDPGYKYTTKFDPDSIKAGNNINSTPLVPPSPTLMKNNLVEQYNYNNTVEGGVKTAIEMFNKRHSYPVEWLLNDIIEMKNTFNGEVAPPSDNLA